MMTTNFNASSLHDPRFFGNTPLDVLQDVDGMIASLVHLQDDQLDPMAASTNSSSNQDSYLSLTLLEPSPISTRDMRVVDHVKPEDLRIPTQTALADLHDLFQVRTTTTEHSTPVTYDTAQTTTFSTFSSKFWTGMERDEMPSSPAIPSTMIAILTSDSSTLSSSSSSDDTNADDHDDPCNSPDRWVERFEDLKRFVLQHGHCHVPIKLERNPTLSKWAKRQRYQWKLKQAGRHSTLTDEREMLLESIGFLWDVRFSVWDQRFRELVAFRKSTGHCNVPLRCERFPKLGTWVKCQRRQHRLLAMGRKSNMTPGRIAQLNDLGFSWRGREGTSCLLDREEDGSFGGEPSTLGTLD
jgi:Helicase associated domain